MAIKNKFIHFKTRAAFNANVPNPALTADEGNTFYNYTTFIQDTKEIYTHGTFYKSNTTWDMLKITEDISYAALFKNNAKVGDIVQLEGAIDFIIFSASIDNSSFMSLLQSSTSDINTYSIYYDDSTQLYILNEDSSLSIANNNNINSIVRSYVEDTYITEKTLEKLPAGTNASITATDSILDAFAKLQGQVNAKANTSSIPTAATAVPKASGTAAVGTSTKYAREDHVHPLQTNVATATKLATPRVIAIAGAVSGSATFDGSSNISINSTLNGFDASKITSGTLNADRLPNIPIEKLPAGALERMFVMESQNAAINAVKAGTIQEGDVVQIGSKGLMYFCIDDAATTFRNAFKEFTAGSATSVPWSGVTNAPTKLSQFSNDAGYLTSVPAQTWASITGKPTFATVATSGSYNDLTNKPSIPSLSGYATQNWVTSQGYLTSIPAATSSAYGGIQIGYTTSGKNYAVQLSNGKAYVNVPWTDTNTTYSSGTNISISGTTINCTYSYTLPTATSSVLGGVKVGSNITISSGTISLSKSNVTSALGYTPANTSDIPEIPTTLPNPKALTINGTSYTGSSAVSVTTSKPLTRGGNTTGTVVAGRNYHTTSSSISSVSGFSYDNPDAVVGSSTKITSFPPTVRKMDGIADLSGSYYVYCFSYIGGYVYVNGAVYA